MNYCSSYEASSIKTADKSSLTQTMFGQEGSGGVLSFLKRGQRITGTVVSVDQQVILDFDGQKVTTSKDVLKNAVPGDKKTFEVVKTSGNEIELRTIENTPDVGRQTVRATVIHDADWNTLQSQKQQSIKQAEKEKELIDTKSKLTEIGAKFTEQDCRKLEQEGFPVEGFSISGLYEAINRIKSDSTGLEKSATADTKTGSQKDIAKRLKEENLPATEENITSIEKALELSGITAKIDDKAMKCLISQEVEPTIGNIYKACYSGNTRKQEQSQALSVQTWKELETQVKTVITSAGYEANQENLQDAKWLLENDLPLTIETFRYKKELESIRSNTDQEAALDKMMEGMKNGTIPMEVSLASQNITSPGQVLADINAITEETVTYAVQNNSELTIRSLITIQERLTAIDQKNSTGDLKAEGSPEAEDAALTGGDSEATASSEVAVTTDSRLEEIKAQRQLEEIRLKMTLESAAKLEKKGFSIETKQLEEVVKALKELEDSYYKERMSEADAKASELQLEYLKDTTQSIEKLKFLPCAVLGSTLSERGTQTIPNLLTEGSRLQEEYAKAGAAYETLMTVPNIEYGDSIKKAFANADSLLSEMNIENTEQNLRAVRILGYNRMDITEEAINQVKAYDQEVTTLIQNLHPAVAVRMIKEGQNPLDMPIHELNVTIDQIKEEQGITSEEKFSTYLRNLEKENGISEEERKAYIGVYRLLYNVEKSDGAALGAVIKADREVTLDNLLTAVLTSKKGRLDAVINDEFGTLQSITRNKESIAEQLNSFTDGRGQQQSGQDQKETLMEEQTQYLDRVLKKIKEELSPEKLQEIGQTLSEAGAQASQITSAIPQLSSEAGTWNTIKNVPVEKLLEQLQNTEETKEAQEESYAAKVQEIRNLCNNSEQSIRFLNDFRVPSSPMNIIMANQILSNGESPITKLFKKQNEKAEENSENSIKDLTNLSDTLIDKSSINEAYEKLEENARDTLKMACSEEKIDSKRIAELKSMGQQITFLKTMAEKEFYQIPIETDQGITNINLTVIRGSGDSGKVAVTIASEKLGNIKADFSLKDQALKGFISSDSRSGLDQLRQYTDEIEKAARENEVTIKQLDFGLQRRELDTYTYQNPVTGEQSTAQDSTERTLYRLAKAVVQMVRTAENSITN